MRTTLVILILAAILFVWTMLRYRKQIVGAIRFVGVLRNAASTVRSARQIGNEPAKTQNELAHCAACGTWVPKERAIRFDSKTFYCSKDCVRSSLKTV